MLRRIKRKSKIILFFLFSLFLICCGSEAPKPKKVIVKIKKKNINVRKNQKQSALENKIKKYIFSLNENSRDPFKSFFNESQVKEEEVTEEDIVRTPLTMYNLSQFKLVAIIKSKHKPPVAMVETGDHVGLFFQVGDFIGRELYKVVSISDNKVILEKKKKDFFNNIKIETKELTINEE